MKRLASALAVWIAGAIVATGDSTAASRICVGGPGCAATLQAAVDIAHDGDTIRIGPGNFAGGVTIDVSITLVGAGANRTAIRGGGPVLTIGAIFAATEPTVSIRGVTITGGVTTSSPESEGFVGADNVIALGGGIEVPPNRNIDGGATVSITNSVITGNRAEPTASVPIGPPCPGHVNCPFAWAGGGGIDTWGPLTLSRSIVSRNVVAGGASDANGAGVYGHLGPVTITKSVVAGNRAIAKAPNGRFADGGGLFIEGGSLTLDTALITNNSVSLSAALPDSVETNANSGGVHIGGNDDCVDPAACVAAAIRNSVVTGNRVASTNSAGSAAGFCGGICNDGALTLKRTNISSNMVFASSPVRDADSDSGGLGMGGPATVNTSRLSGNGVRATAPAGTATASAGALSTGDQAVATTVDDSVISANHISAASTGGRAIVFGAGLANGGLLTVTNTAVVANRGHAAARRGSAHGGGIWNSSFAGRPPFGELRLQGSVVSGNALTVEGAITSAGGGLYTDGPVTLAQDHIVGNAPDNCSGVSC